LLFVQSWQSKRIKWQLKKVNRPTLPFIRTQLQKEPSQIYNNSALQLAVPNGYAPIDLRMRLPS